MTFEDRIGSAGLFLQLAYGLIVSLGAMSLWV